MKALAGFPTLYNKLIRHSGRWEMLLPGVFDKSLRSGPPIELLLDHRDYVGDTRDILQVQSNDTGLAMRAWLPDTEHGRTARRIGETGRTGASVWFCPTKTETRRINHVDVVCFIEAYLWEVSYLSAYDFGAVEESWIAYGDVDFSESLENQCRSGRLLNVGAAINAKRTLVIDG